MVSSNCNLGWSWLLVCVIAHACYCNKSKIETAFSWVTVRLGIHSMDLAIFKDPKAAYSTARCVFARGNTLIEGRSYQRCAFGLQAVPDEARLAPSNTKAHKSLPFLSMSLASSWFGQAGKKLCQLVFHGHFFHYKKTVCFSDIWHANRRSTWIFSVLRSMLYID